MRAAISHSYVVIITGKFQKRLSTYRVIAWIAKVLGSLVLLIPNTFATRAITYITHSGKISRIASHFKMK